MGDYKMKPIRKNSKNYIKIEIANGMLRKFDDPETAVMGIISNLFSDVGIDRLSFEETIIGYNRYTFEFTTKVKPIEIELNGVQSVQ